MEHGNTEGHSRKIHRVFEILGHKDGGVYIAELIVLVTVLLGVGVYMYLVKTLSFSDWLTGCTFRKVTGIICPGCGSTRAMLELLHGHILKALYYHAALVLLVVMCAVYLITQTIKLISKGRTWAMSFRVAYVYVWLVVELAQYIIKLMVPGYNI